MPKSVTTGPAVRRRLAAIQRRLLVARKAAGLSQEKLAGVLGVSSRSLRDWERGYDIPGLAHLIDWARVLGFRLVLVELEAGPVLAPVSLGPGESLVEHEVGRMAVPLKVRREERGISQTDLGLIVGVTRSSLQRWEDRQQIPVAVSLVSWADRLGYTVGLMPFSGEVWSGSLEQVGQERGNTVGVHGVEGGGDDVQQPCAGCVACDEGEAQAEV